MVALLGVMISQCAKMSDAITLSYSLTETAKVLENKVEAAEKLYKKGTIKI